MDKTEPLEEKSGNRTPEDHLLLRIDTNKHLASLLNTGDLSSHKKFKKIMRVISESPHFGIGYDQHIGFKMNNLDYKATIELGLDSGKVAFRLSITKFMPDLFIKSRVPDLLVDSMILDEKEIVEYLRLLKLIGTYIENRHKVTLLQFQNDYMETFLRKEDGESEDN